MLGHRIGLDVWSREKCLALAGNRTSVIQPTTILTEMSGKSFNDVA
jgi:hypothetical protein